MSKLERIMQQLEDGTYKVSSEKIAEKLLKKNPKLSDKVVEATRVVGEVDKNLNVSDHMEEGFSHLFQIDFFHNVVQYGSYLIGAYADGTWAVVEWYGDHYEAFDDAGEMAEEFERDVEEKLIELELV